MMFDSLNPAWSFGLSTSISSGSACDSLKYAAAVELLGFARICCGVFNFKKNGGLRNGGARPAVCGEKMPSSHAPISRADTATWYWQSARSDEYSLVVAEHITRTMHYINA